jgi:hypothetical protein
MFKALADVACPPLTAAQVLAVVVLAITLISMSTLMEAAEDSLVAVAVLVDIA